MENLIASYYQPAEGGGGAKADPAEALTPNNVVFAVAHGWLGAAYLPGARRLLLEAVLGEPLAPAPGDPVATEEQNVMVEVNYAFSGVKVMRESFPPSTTVDKVMEAACRLKSFSVPDRVSYRPDQLKVFYIQKDNLLNCTLDKNLASFNKNDIVLLVNPPYGSVVCLLEEALDQVEGDQIPLDFIVNIKGERLTVKFDVEKDSLMSLFRDSEWPIQKDEIVQITPNEDLKEHRVFLSFESEDKTGLVKINCHTYTFDCFGDLNELFSNGKGDITQQVEVKGMVDDSKVKFIFSGGITLDFRMIPSLLNPDNSINNFDKYFTIQTDLIPNTSQTMSYIISKQPSDRHQCTAGLPNPEHDVDCAW